MDFTKENHINSDLNVCKSAVGISVPPNQQCSGGKHVFGMASDRWAILTVVAANTL